MAEIKDPENFFYACNGEVLHDLDEMFLFIKSCNEGELAHHFNSERNDFANWTNDILKQKALSKQLEKATTREHLISVLQPKLEKGRHKRRSKKNIFVFTIILITLPNLLPDIIVFSEPLPIILTVLFINKFSL